ncbi:MAG: TIGR04086 family membrane protein [Clostridia bacterium]|nr:TIGR04086 family membrane protein [Clostridia bacterium]
MQNQFSVLQPLKAALFATLLGLAFSLVFAVICYFFPLSPTVIRVIAQTLKAISLALGCFLCLSKEGGWWKGLTAGLLFTALSFLTFSAFGGDFSLSWLIALDLLFGLFVGALGGIAAVNLKKG